MKVFRYVGVFLVVGAVIAAGLVAWSVRPGRYDGWIETTGTVIDHEVTWSTDSETRRTTELRAPVVEFTDESGERVVVTAASSSSSWPAVGSTVRLRYPPGQPTEARTDEEQWFFPIFFGIWALVLGLVGGMFLVVAKVFKQDVAEDTSEPIDPIEAQHELDTSEGPWPRYSRPDDE